MAALAPELQALIAATARRWDIPAAVLAAVVWVESEGNPRAVGNAGEIGLVQMMPATARGLGYAGQMGSAAGLTGLFEPAQNLAYGARYLGELYRNAVAHGYSWAEAISAYNAGGSAVRPGDGKRVGAGAGLTPAQARGYPLVNTLYVSRVLAAAGDLRAAKDVAMPAVGWLLILGAAGAYLISRSDND